MKLKEAKKEQASLKNAFNIQIIRADFTGQLCRGLKVVLAVLEQRNCGTF